MRLLNMVSQLVRDAARNFAADDAPSRGASTAYYTIFSLAPVLLVVVAITGLVFGREAWPGT